MAKGIVKASSLVSSGVKVRTLIAGHPGIGKTSVALTAPKPLLIDADHGVLRSTANAASVDVVYPDTYEDILEILTPSDVSEYETIIFDTVSKLQDLMKVWAIKKDPKYGQRDGSLSLKGYGFIAKEMSRLFDYCCYELNKNVIYIFQTVEDKDNDNTRLRIKVEGATKNNVWENVDLGGFVEMYGNHRTIGFSNCERYFAKGSNGISGIRIIPAVVDGQTGDFLTLLFEEYNANLANEVKSRAKKNEEYDAAMKIAKDICDGITDVESANRSMDAIKNVPDVLTSKKESAAMFKAKVKELGLEFNKETNAYEVK